MISRLSRLAALVALLACTLASSARAAQFDLQTASFADVQAAYDAGALTAEKLVQLLQARIDAYDQKGPKINAVITVNPKALETARALDAERKAKGPRSPLHGIPVLLKDNYDTFDLPTTGGSKALVGHMAKDDAFTVAKLRAAGAIIFAKVNLSELASSGVSISSLLGQTYNPYDLTRTPGGSSGGTGAAVAAVFGLAGTGSDTGQSTRSPASANNGVGIRPTFGLISRDGIIPLSFTQDTAGPIAKCVADAAAMMDAMVGFDPADTSMWAAIGKAPKSYLPSLDKNGLKGARIGWIPELFGDGSHPEHAWVTDVTKKALADMEKAGATVIKVSIPQAGVYAKNLSEISASNFERKWVMDHYFATSGPGSKYKDLADYIAHAADTHPPVYAAFKKASEAKEDALRNPAYLKALEAQARFRDLLVKVMDEQKLDVLFYPHQRRLVVPASPTADQVERNGFMGSSTGLPAITFQAGFSPVTPTAPIGVPIGIEFLGRPFSEPTLIKLAYSYEQATHHRKSPVSTPALPGESFSY